MRKRVTGLTAVAVGKGSAEVTAELVPIMRTAYRVMYLNVDAPTNADVIAGVEKTVSEVKLIARDRCGLNHYTDEQVFSQLRFSQVTGDIEVVTKREISCGESR